MVISGAITALVVALIVIVLVSFEYRNIRNHRPPIHDKTKSAPAADEDRPDQAD